MTINPYDIKRRAEASTRSTGLPGWGNGPADAFRHMVGVAELRRRLGKRIATAAADYNERQGNREGQSPEAEEMDRINNEIGLRFGAKAKSYRDVIRMVRLEIEKARRAQAETGETPTDGRVARFLP